MAALTIWSIVQVQHREHVSDNSKRTASVAEMTEADEMAYLNTTTRAAGFGLRDRVAAMVRTFNEGAARRRIYRQTMTELCALSDRELADLGITAAMIKRIALEAANGK
jgi:uncharacterized protein YjiS (DUF1127 family)